MKPIHYLIIVLLWTSHPFAEQAWSQKQQQAPLITEYIVGKPNIHYLQVQKRVAKRWGIRIKQVFAGCVVNKETEKKRLFFEKANQKAYDFYSKKFGKDWERVFINEISKEAQRDATNSR